MQVITAANWLSLPDTHVYSTDCLSCANEKRITTTNRILHPSCLAVICLESTGYIFNETLTKTIFGNEFLLLKLSKKFD